MTSMDSQEHGRREPGSTGRDTPNQDRPGQDRHTAWDGHSDGSDPVHPGASERLAEHAGRTEDGAREHAAVESSAGQGTHTAQPRTQSLPPLAADLGAPAILEHRLVALEIGSAVCPVAIHRWTGSQVGTLLLTPTQAQVWARAGRLTLATSEGLEHRLTVLAPEEAAGVPLGAHWPLGEPAGRAKRIAAAAVHDVGDLLTFPAWLAHTAHLSGARNQQLARLVNQIRTASPGTAVYYGQTFGHLHARPEQHHPYDHRGLVGHEGWPREL